MKLELVRGGGVLLKNKNNRLDVVMFHINPLEKVNQDFNHIEQTIINKIGNLIPLQGFLFGSKNLFTKFTGSVEMFENFEWLMYKLNIPCTKFKGLPSPEEVSIAYNAYSDQWTIFAKSLDLSKQNLLKNITNYFDETYIYEEDNLILDIAA